MGIVASLMKMLGFGGRGLDELSAVLDINQQRLHEFEPHYRVFTQRKKGGGTRVIHAPDRDTAELQRTILYRLLAKLPIHPAATGFRPGISIADNAAPHVGRDVIIRLDLKDFFWSISPIKVQKMFRRLGWNSAAAKTIARLCTISQLEKPDNGIFSDGKRGGLPQGAPTSPALSNAVNLLLDMRLAGLTRAYDATYTRYADDITFSLDEECSDRTSFSAVKALLNVAKNILADEGYQCKQCKQRVLRQHQRQSVTGLVVNEHVAIPRDRRRLLRAIRHRVATGREATLTQEQLLGWRGYEQMVEKVAQRESK